MDDESVGIPNPYLPLSDYGLIGDSRSAALVSRHGSIDWCCWPNFDGPSLFARLLDHERGGYFAISPSVPYRTRRRYVGPTAVLETVFEAPDGAVRLTDLMPVFSETEKRCRPRPFRYILRRLEGIRGAVPMRLSYVPRPEFGTAAPDLYSRGPGDVFAQVGQRLLHLRSDLLLEPAGSELHTSFSVRAGEVHHFALAYSQDAPSVYPALGKEADDEIEASITFWRQWGSQCSYEGPHPEAILRSALVLKLLSFAPSGAIVAAPTTSLPEAIGADYNWDYRYCWLRDASFTVLGLYDLGFEAEGDAFVQWMLHATRLTHPALQVVYDVYGEARLPEQELPHLEGYRSSRPVRVGNGAYSQHQIDVYGEVLSAIEHYVKRTRDLDREARGLVSGAADLISSRWHEPDHGIWEERGKPEHHVHGKVMAWRALDSAIRITEDFRLKASPDKWKIAREAIRSAVLSRGYNPRLNSFTRVFDGDDLDGSLLAIPLVGFLPGDDPRMAGTMEAVRRALGAGDLVYRLRPAGVSTYGREGAFLACSFWLVGSLASAGRLGEAMDLFDQLVARSNDLGLLPEEIDPVSGTFLGNYPQGLSHVGLIRAGLALREAEKATTSGAGRRSPGWPRTPGGPG